MNASITKSFYGLFALGLPVCAALFLSAPRAEAACNSPLGGPEVEDYIEAMQTGRISYTIDPAGWIKYSNNTACTIKLRLYSTKITIGNGEELFKSSSVAEVPPGGAVTLTVPVPNCNYRLVAQPYAAMQYDANGKPLLHTLLTKNRGTCVPGTPNYPIATRSTYLAYNAPDYLPPSIDMPKTSCVLVRTMNYDARGNLLSAAAPGMSVYLDLQKTADTNRYGYAVFGGVDAGLHTVTQGVPSGWSQISVTPAGGHVQVTRGAGCASVTFKNQQLSDKDRGLSLNVTATPSDVRGGDTVAYAIAVVNSDVKGRYTEVRGYYDKSTSFIGATGGGISMPGSTVLWHDVYVPAKSSKTLMAYVRVPDSPTRSTLQFEADASGMRDTQFTRVATTVNPSSGRSSSRYPYTYRYYYPAAPSNSSYPYTTSWVQNGNVTISLVPCRTQANVGDHLCYTLTVYNNSSYPATDVRLVDSFNSADINFFLASDDGQILPSLIEWNFPVLAAGERKVIMIRGQILASHKRSSIRNALTVSSYGTGAKTIYADVSLDCCVLPATGVFADFFQPLADATGLTPLAVDAAAAGSLGLFVTLLVMAGGLTAGGYVTVRKYRGR